MFDLVPFILGLFIAIVFYIAYRNVVLLKQNIKLKKQLNQNQPNGYDKFVADSREWAFGYIEQVQQNLLELDEIINNLSNKSKATKTDLLNDRSAIVAKINQITEDLLPKQNDER